MKTRNTHVGSFCKDRDVQSIRIVFVDEMQATEYVGCIAIWLFHSVKAVADFFLQDPEYKLCKYSNELKQGKNPVWFMSEGFKLAGNIFTPVGFRKGKKYPTIITVTPAGAVKEQAAGLYAQKLSELGYITLAFDHRTFGESEGFARYREDPFMKVYDIKHAITEIS